jgi:hypothetical protein
MSFMLRLDPESLNHRIAVRRDDDESVPVTLEFDGKDRLDGVATIDLSQHHAEHLYDELGKVLGKVPMAQEIS